MKPVVVALVVCSLLLALAAWQQRPRPMVVRNAQKNTQTAAHERLSLPTSATTRQLANYHAKQQRADRFAEEVDNKAALPAAEDLSCHARDGYDIAGDAAFNWGLSFHVATAAECCAACAAQRRVCTGKASSGKVYWATKRLPDGPTQRQPPPIQGRCGGQGSCNAWVFCPGAGDGPAPDRCFSYTIHNHSQGECWLKHEANLSHPVAHGPLLPAAMVAAPRREWPWAIDPKVWPWAPERRVPWQAGLLAPRRQSTWQGTRLPIWHHHFCKKHDCGAETRAADV